MNTPTPLVLTAYLPPISFFALLVRSKKVQIEIEDHYVKQTFRNRCELVGANGRLNLTVPIKKDEDKCPTRNIRLDYCTDWNRIHWNTICSAYGSTPFFEYYKDDLEPFYSQKWTYLWEYNYEIIKSLLNALEIDCEIEHTLEYVDKWDATIEDCRESFFPKAKDIKKPTPFTAHPYRQLFSSRYGFVENLSIVDLLFNKGPESHEILWKSIPQNN